MALPAAVYLGGKSIIAGVGVLSSLGVLGWIKDNFIGDVHKWLSQHNNPEWKPVGNNGGEDSLSFFLRGGYKFFLVVHKPVARDLQAIDDFFEAYGYRVDRWQKVNLKVRESFTFIKCRDVSIRGTNNRAIGQMRSMLVNGCRFWNSEEIGNV